MKTNKILFYAIIAITVIIVAVIIYNRRNEKKRQELIAKAESEGSTLPPEILKSFEGIPKNDWTKYINTTI